ncbi:MAG: lipopolysaccharide heptosyltransferase I [Candidatus Polarisedimenticolaceae bacterium]|nr:lipopolysaccharide heptosyltransferase I [Candidatus Polarisedimenticolaceae bacterium]
MRVLIVKTSSLGDVIHTLPAVTDAAAAIPGISFDWVVEEAFAEIPAAHPAVQRVIPIALRRWRKNWKCISLKAPAFGSRAGFQAFAQNLRRENYDLIIDAQGLMFKSALVAMLAKGPRTGYDRNSARDPWVALTYGQRHRISHEQHAIARLRQLFAQALNYKLPETAPEYGLAQRDQTQTDGTPYLVFLHGTTWPSKHWPEPYWAELITLVTQQGLAVHLPWGGDEERLRAERLAADNAAVQILPQMNLTELMQELRGAVAVVGLDSGLSHLAAALAVPGVTIYGPTRTDLTGVIGSHHQNLVAEFPCAPCLKRRCDYVGESAVQPACYEQLTSAKVWESFQKQTQWVAA